MENPASVHGDYALAGQYQPREALEAVQGKPAGVKSTYTASPTVINFLLESKVRR